jgi:hypothetical protein
MLKTYVRSLQNVSSEVKCQLNYYITFQEEPTLLSHRGKGITRTRSLINVTMDLDSNVHLSSMFQ